MSETQEICDLINNHIEEMASRVRTGLEIQSLYKQVTSNINPGKYSIFIIFTRGFSLYIYELDRQSVLSGDHHGFCFVETPTGFYIWRTQHIPFRTQPKTCHYPENSTQNSSLAKRLSL